MRTPRPGFAFLHLRCDGCAANCAGTKRAPARRASPRTLTACNKLAQEQAARAGYFGLPPAFDPRFGSPTGPSQVEQRLQERQAADACMRAKGYALVPVGK
jgi:hypothetical protein